MNRWYFWISAVRLAFGQLMANKMRSLLTTLGVVVGVASVTAVIAVLSGLKTKVLAEFESFGASRVFIFPDRPDGVPNNRFGWSDIRLKPNEVAELRDKWPSIKAITPVTDLEATIESETERLDGVSVTGIWPDWHACESRKVIEGRTFNRIDEESVRQVCLVNESATQELALVGNPVGQTILINGRRYLIVGIVETIQSRMFGMGGPTAEVFVPFSVADKLHQSRRYFLRVSAMLKSPELADEAKSEARYLLRRMRGLTAEDPDTFRVEAIDQYIDQFKSLASGITAVASGVVGISLLVGGIGIMNIMLVSVSERTREIGLRKAVGATPGAIMAQFLLEAVALSFVGGFVGIGIGRLMALGVASIPDAGLEQVYVPFWAVLMSFGFCAIVGVVFGFVPAMKASRLDPIEALRHE
ncbi:MAG: ABC transporter permease [Planctomycetota bacterium]|nr:ABC transporter permease [Planctomycetota bacterium]MDA1106276.1 ABC transporter permease [Planctomycetota bacterium]